MKIKITFESEEWNEVAEATNVLEAEANLEAMARHYQRVLLGAPVVLPNERDEDETENVAMARPSNR